MRSPRRHGHLGNGLEGEIWNEDTKLYFNRDAELLPCTTLYIYIVSTLLVPYIRRVHVCAKECALDARAFRTL